MWELWYLSPEGLRSSGCRIPGVVREAVQAVCEVVCELLSGGAAHKRPRDRDWDTRPWRPKRRPRLEKVNVDEVAPPSAFVVHEPEAAATTLRRESLTPQQRGLLHVVETEAGCEVALSASLASLFDSLRMMGVVVAARTETGLAVTLRATLGCNTVADLLTLPEVLATTASSASSGSGDATAASQNAQLSFRIPQYSYMFRCSTAWALVPDSSINEAALRGALEDLSARHEALRTQLTDPPLLFDIAMEAAGNLSLLRALADRSSTHGLVLLRRSCSVVGSALLAAWPRVMVCKAGTIPVPMEVVDCSGSEQLELRSSWLLDGRNAVRMLNTPMHAVVLHVADEGDGASVLPRLHIIVSHGFGDGFAGLPLLRDLQRLYFNHCERLADEGDDSAKAATERSPKRAKKVSDGLLSEAALPSSTSIIERRMRAALLRNGVESEISDVASGALPRQCCAAFDHFVWLARQTLRTLESVAAERHWRCPLDTALLGALACALLRLRPPHGQPGMLRLRLQAAMRDGPDEGLLVANLAEWRDIDLEFKEGASVEAAARAVVRAVRRREWRPPDAMTDNSDRVYVNLRPLFEALGGTPGRALRHQTVWPPVHGESRWDCREVRDPLWIMADQVDTHEWVLYLKVLWSRPQDADLGRILKGVLEDLALRPSTPLLL
eukprot:NODE_279_length_3239_cov_11.437982.p1 GENE.NODE_279_length_3239_cov_11.437982~~NODE_279_length_3239_cov_11.437982.p1  ORF type:complete len:669 (+),score=211.19 NODE_279_length_3239_cov_11.437982:717-2723(+)